MPFPYNELKCEMFSEKYLGKLLENLHNWYQSQEFANVKDVIISSYEDGVGVECWLVRIYYTLDGYEEDGYNEEE